MKAHVAAGALKVQELHQIIVMDPQATRRTYLVSALAGLAGCQAEGLAPEPSDLADRFPALCDCVLLVQSADFDMAQLCETIRQLDYTGPILALVSESDIFLQEADEILPLPVAIPHLASRIKAHTSLHLSHEMAEIALGDYVLKTGVRQLVLPDGKNFKLTEKETRILRFLHRAQGQPVSREALLSEIWGYDSRLTTHTLETHIYRLRQKSETGSHGQVLLVTEAGGYRLAV
jgi:DNA-binding response OmpR family regulator